MNERHEQQLIELKKVLDIIKFESVLELGAGWGRVTDLIKTNYNPEEYTVIDISPERLEQINDVHKWTYDITEIGDIMPKYDLVIATETLLHILPEKIEDMINMMKNNTNKYVVTMDYYPKVKPSSLSPHNFLHNYPELFGNADEIRINDVQSIFVWEK